MKFNIKYTIAALSVFMFTAGCDDKLDAIDVIGYTGVPVAIETVTSEPLPGQIQLVRGRSYAPGIPSQNQQRAR